MRCAALGVKRAVVSPSRGLRSPAGDSASVACFFTVHSDASETAVRRWIIQMHGIVSYCKASGVIAELSAACCKKDQFNGMPVGFRLLLHPALRDFTADEKKAISNLWTLGLAGDREGPF